MSEQATEMTTYAAQRSTSQWKEKADKSKTSLYHMELLITVALRAGDIQLKEVKQNFSGNTPAAYLFCREVVCLIIFLQFALLPQCEWQKL